MRSQTGATYEVIGIMITMGKDDIRVVEARPFIHQVGGRAVMLEITPETICKLYKEKEFQFYKHKPDYLKEFTPHYKGLVSIKCSQDGDIPMFHAEVPGCILQNTDYPNNIEKREEVKSGLDNWSLSRIHKEVKYKGLCSSSDKHDYTMLGNLVGSLRMPCILDLKIGTQQTGDDTTEEERRVREDRSANSTSGTMGIRLSGMHMYEAETNTYLSHNKHHGWTLDDAGLRQELRRFFHNSCVLNVRDITRIINKLRRLHRILSIQDKFYFFGSSLLLFYDGYLNNDHCSDHSKEGTTPSEKFDQSEKGLNVDQPTSSDEKDKRKNEGEGLNSVHLPECEYDTSTADVRLIDFGRTVLKSDMKEHSYGTQFEEGILFGLVNLIDILQSIADN
ncbi:inositol hexakisphosphate kinase 3-like isoform X2 [Mizuhopecten yessoensis]|uniref:inositol hexakisphosphate kinase 3-like isoform X2 n=1 Tax=Mizuhopecten yessoensis TaxID=6573 RepID=UPI000B457E7B|nr:inositol hexakisphosphate kinase 3-like isoform X2 [Mizuhopecten yessoensis]